MYDLKDTIKRTMLAEGFTLEEYLESIQDFENELTLEKSQLATNDITKLSEVDNEDTYL